MASRVKKRKDTATNRDSDKIIVRLPDGMRDELQSLADRHGRSMTAEVVTALAIHFANSTIERPVAPDRVLDVYELLFQIGKAVDALTKEVAGLKDAQKKRG